VKEWRRLRGAPKPAGERAGSVATDAQREQALEQLPPGEAALVVQAYQTLHFVVHLTSLGPKLESRPNERA
jgi:hypothetical protein